MHVQGWLGPVCAQEVPVQAARAPTLPAAQGTLAAQADSLAEARARVTADVRRIEVGVEEAVGLVIATASRQADSAACCLLAAQAP